MVAAYLRARDSYFIDNTSSSGVLAVQADMSSEFEGLFCSFVGWSGSDVVRIPGRGGRIMGDYCSGSLASIARDGGPQGTCLSGLGPGSLDRFMVAST